MLQMRHLTAGPKSSAGSGWKRHPELKDEATRRKKNTKLHFLILPGQSFEEPRTKNSYILLFCEQMNNFEEFFRPSKQFFLLLRTQTICQHRRGSEFGFSHSLLFYSGINASASDCLSWVPNVQASELSHCCLGPTFTSDFVWMPFEASDISDRTDPRCSKWFQPGKSKESLGEKNEYSNIRSTPN